MQSPVKIDDNVSTTGQISPADVAEIAKAGFAAIVNNRPDGEEPGQPAKESVEAAADALRSGLHILVYPEGTRSLDGRLSTFKKGPFFLAMETQAPIVPIAISGTQTMMRKGSNAITPGLAQIQLLPAIEPSNFATREELLLAVRNAIAEALPAEMKPAAI